jgi:hypothetical protein
MYFYQQTDGTIPVVFYETDDSAFYVQVKLAAINMFQTSLKSGSFVVTDPTGVHAASFALQALTIRSNFTASSYKSFMDPAVNAGNIKLAASASVTFHPSDGSIVAAANQQHVVSVTGQPAGTPAPPANSGYNQFMSSVGTLAATLAPGQTARFSQVASFNYTQRAMGSLLEVARIQHQAAAAANAKDVAAALPRLMRASHNKVSYRSCSSIHSFVAY